MYMKLFLVFLCVYSTFATNIFNPYPKNRRYVFHGDSAGPRLFLSKYLKQNKVAEARNLSLVTGIKPSITSYSGFLTVDEACDSHLYFWYFPSQNKINEDPVTVWLQGGPGATSIYGLLAESGPYNLNLNGSLELREYSWNRYSSMIYIDNPVGTGFSYTGKSCYATEESQVGQNLLTALEQFFQIFPELSDNPFFLTGESYAGKYIPAVAYSILKSNSTINLEGIMIGNGLVDPLNMQVYSNYTYQLGLIDEKTRIEVESLEEKARQAIRDENWPIAAANMNAVLGAVKSASQFNSTFNYLYPNGQPEADVGGFVTRTDIRKALHVGNATWNDGQKVYDQLALDIPKSVKPWLEELLENYRVMTYNGQLDIIVAYPLTENYLQLLEWSHAKEYRQANRKLWQVDGELAGYAKSAGAFTEVLVRNAGHVVLIDQPKWAFDLFNRFIFNLTIGG